MRTLFGIAIPDSAVSVVVCPILGPGRTMSLYRGDLRNGDSDVDEDFVIGRVAANKDFWQYIDAKVQEGKIGKSSGNLFSFRLSLKFLDQTGAACIVDPAGGETFKTAEAFEFHRLSSTDSDDLRARAEVYTRAATDTLARAAEQGRAIIETATANAAKVVESYMKPLDRLVGIVEEGYRTERERVNSAVRNTVSSKAAASSPTDWVQTTTGLVNLASALKKTFGPN